MVPGSTLRYGSSFWRETVKRRAFRMFPIEAAVMPLPREETTPPVTKTYFDIDDLQGGFTEFTGKRTRRPHLASPLGGEGHPSPGFALRLQHVDLRPRFRGPRRRPR